MSYDAVAENSKNLARKYVSEGNFGRAFSHYLVALKLNPDWREQLREEFSTVLCKWGTTLDVKKRYSDLFTCYEQAVEIYPNNVVILNNLGAHLLSLKASFLWDFGPQISAAQIFNFVKDLKSYLNNADLILVIDVDRNILITNVNACLKTLLLDKYFIEIDNGSFQLVKQSEKEYLKELIGLLKCKLSTLEVCEIWEVNKSEVTCPPCLFGLLLNFPLVYCFYKDYSPFSVKLKVYTVSCEFKFQNVHSRFQVFSFSIPQSVLNFDIDNFVSLWFENLQFSGKNIFSHLSLESSFEEVEALILCGLLREAAHYFRKCINTDRYFIRAAHNLESVANMAVERWHFRMLNDEHRNEAFREAILKKVSQGFRRVLDVGTGTGILSLFCAEGKAEEIYACDSSSIMCEIAEQVFLSNNAPTVKLLGKHSTDISVAEDIRKKVSLLVTETFDAALLGEDILNTLSHAWQHLLLPPQPNLISPSPKFGFVIPVGAVLYVTGIELESVANYFHLKNIASSPLLKNCNIFQNCDSYDTQNLSRCQFKYLTNTTKLLQLNFNDPKSFAAVLSESRKEIVLNCITPGRLDCFAVWFDLHLDEDIVLNTGPLSKKNTAWDQAIFPLPRSVLVQEHQNVTLSFAFQNGKLNINTSDYKKGFELSQNVIKIFRDENLWKVFEEVTKKLSQGYNEPIIVLDCYPFPLFGFNLLMHRKIGKFADKLICCPATENERELINFLAQEHEIDVEILLKTENDLESIRGKELDVILLDLVELNGEIKDGVLVELDRLRLNLKPNGIILPQQVTVMGQFIHSDWLYRASKVLDDSVTCGYKIAEFINVYQVQQFIDLDLRTVEKTLCSDPFELFNLFDFTESITEKTVPLRSNSPVHVNALAYWFRIKFVEGCGEILTNESTYYHQAAFLISDKEFFKNIKFNIIRNNELFKIEMLKS